MDRKNELLVRVYLVMLCFLIASALILYRVIKISVIEGDKWRTKGEQLVKWIPVEADRGNIYADDGNLLATSLQFFEIRMDPVAVAKVDFNQHVDALCEKLAEYQIRNKSKQEWRDYIVGARKGWESHRKKGSRNLLIAKDASYNEYKLLKSFPLFKLGQYRGGFIVNRTTKRSKPFKDLASRTIGEHRANADMTGIEGYFNTRLTGDTLHKLMKRLPGGLWLPLYDPTEIEPRKGQDIYTSINVHLQDIVHDELKNAVEKFQAEGGTAILMEVETGAIKAISNLGADKNKAYREIFNYGIGRLSEPGSTFKLASVMSLLEDGKASLDTEVDIFKGRKKFFDLWMEDSEPHQINRTTLKHAFEISSNVGIATLVNEAYKNDEAPQYVKNLENFGLKDKMGIEIDGEPSPYIKDPIKNKKDWYGTTLPWMAHGYELMLTPLQILNFYNTVANDGKMMKPYLVTEIKHKEKTVKRFEPKVVKRKIASTSTIAAAQELLEGVVQRGTAKKLKSTSYDFAGKTGTASTNYANQGGKKKGHIASFAGYFPANSPSYSLIVVVYEPVGAYYGSKVAGPVFRNVADKVFSVQKDMHKAMNDTDSQELASLAGVNMSRGYKDDFKQVFDYLNMDYHLDEGRWVKVQPNDQLLTVTKEKILKSKVPDVRGMGLRDAIYVLENLGMDVEVHGFGKVKKQTIRPGSKIMGQTVEIYLN
jgi:cell division protein FtsI (penicillin-binding protein 3)